MVVLAALVIQGCRSKELTQQNAKEIIESSALYTFGTHEVVITPAGANALVKVGYAAWTGNDASHLAITTEGESFFEGVSSGADASRSSSTSPFIVVPKFPLRRRIVGITNIKTTPDGTILDYTWAWDSEKQPAILKQLLPALTEVNEDRATFRHSRDGWLVSWPNEQHLGLPQLH
jgi:hypothetical protein